MLRLSPRQLLRGGEAKAAGLDDPSLDDNRLIEAMLSNPAVIERPIVVVGHQARIGRPPERAGNPVIRPNLVDRRTCGAHVLWC